MKPENHFIFPLTVIFSITLLAGCSKAGGDKPAEAPEKAEVQTKAGMTIDTATQARIGLKIETPAATQWQPEAKSYGRVIDPATLSAAVTDLESARAAAEVSGKEFERQKTLAAQNNASARTLEAAKAASTHDGLAFESALAKFKLDWGSALAEGTNREMTLKAAIKGTAALVRVDLPAGETLPAPPVAARIVALTDETRFVTAVFVGATEGVNPQTQSQSVFFLVNGQPLTPGVAVTGYLRISSDAVGGVIIPASAILRHEGKGWVYVQTETNQFVREGIPLDRMVDQGWFVAEHLSATNRIVVSGAQTVLSAELGGGFNTGTRD